MSGTDVVVTGTGVVSNIGIGVRPFWENLLAGKIGISSVAGFDVSGYPIKHGGQINGINFADYLRPESIEEHPRAGLLAATAAKMAMKEAGYISNEGKARRIGVVIGTTDGNCSSIEKANDLLQKEHKVPNKLYRHIPNNRIAYAICKETGAAGVSMVISNACSAGNAAIAFGVRLLKSGAADVVVAGGAESFSRKTFTGFMRLNAITEDVCRPFDLNRRGIIVSEGAAILVMEKEEHAIRRGATPIARILGCGLSCDAFHMTQPSPDGMAAAMKKALVEGGISPSDVDYVCAHGTGTRMNDVAEYQALRTIFGSDIPPVSSIKGSIGHTMGAASAMGAVASIMAIREGVMPPTTNFVTSDPDCPLDCVSGGPRSGKIKIVQNNGFAFGGNNAIVLLGAA